MAVKINVSEQIAGRCPDSNSPGRRLIQAAAKQLQRGRLDRDGFVRVDARTAAAIRVTPESAERAVGLFTALISAWESAGHQVRPSANAVDGGTEFLVGSDSALVGLIELKDSCRQR